MTLLSHTGRHFDKLVTGIYLFIEITRITLEALWQGEVIKNIYDENTKGNTFSFRTSLLFHSILIVATFYAWSTFSLT